MSTNYNDFPGGQVVLESEVEIPEAIRMIDRSLEEVVTAGFIDLAERMVEEYQGAIETVGAIDTGYFRDTVKVREMSIEGLEKTAYVASDAPYSGVVEYGWIVRGRGQASYPGRYPGNLAISNLLTSGAVNSAFENQLMRHGMFSGMGTPEGRQYANIFIGSRNL